MSKFVCLSCHKEFKVAVRAPMSCPTKHLCQIVQSETTATPLSPPPPTQPPADPVVANVLRDDCSIPLPPLSLKSPARSTATLPNLGERKTAALPPAPVASPGVVKRQTVPLPTSTPVIPFAAPLVEKGQPPAVYSPSKVKPSAKPEVQPQSTDSESFALDDFVSNSATSTSHRAIPTTAEPVVPASPVPVDTAPAILIVDGFQFPITHGNILGREGDIARDLFRKDKTIGRIHARLDITPKNEIAVRNLAHSGNPVVIDGHSIAFNQTAILKPGLHQLQLGTRFLCSINVTAGANQK